ncbi:hypothetical protein DBR47_00700 [Paucibacter sp. KBW04]|uniref:SGNH/GDSL hydrolase family protein n=1 Tax=Paucibacter sp. KBW04 TaxID=2153361 RepID=UPI000F5789F4|nr:GDSL-type esterase/lipase family protein [Paucibacter sp. KBW04]RQO63125.1 hypothetical protein DBR47_00700 [Paucibacter sp. KBW04]
MSIRLNRGQKINGVDYPAGIAIVGLDKEVEALASQGGGATSVNLAVVDASSVSGSGIPSSARTAPLKMAIGFDSISAAGALLHPIPFAGYELGLYQNPLVTTNLNATTTSSFVMSAAADGFCGVNDTVTLAFDGVKAMTVNVAGEGAGLPVDVTGGGFFRLVSGGGVKGACVQVRWDPRAGTRPGAVSDTTASNLGQRTKSLLNASAWCAPAMAMNGFDSLQIRNYGIPGDTTTDVKNRIAQITAWAPDVVMMLVGINNYSSPTAPAEVLDLVAAFNAAGAFVLITTTLPSAIATTALAKAYANLVTTIKNLARSGSYRCQVFDGASLMASPTVAIGNGVVNAAYYRTDYLHPNLLGTIQGLGPKLTQAIARVIPPTRPALSSALDVYDAAVNPSGNLLGTKGMFAGTTGTFGLTPAPTGQLGTGWIDGNSGAFPFTSVVYTAADSGSPIPRTDGLPGNWNRVVATNAVGGSAVRQVYTPLTGLAPGVKFRLHFTCRVSSATLVNRLEAYVQLTCSTNGTAYNRALSLPGTAGMISGALADSGAMYWSSDVMQCPADMTAAFFAFEYGCASTGSITFDWADAKVEIVP